MSYHPAYSAVMLDCGHKLLFYPIHKPNTGDELWCERCRDMRIVLPPPIEWIARCDQCYYCRKFGADKTAANLAAAKHHRVKGHNVDVVCTNRVIALRGAR